MKAFFRRVYDYFSLVKFSHTIFAMPFALLGFFTAVNTTNQSFDLRLLLLIILCMVFARNAAMGFNRYADYKIDSRNPRTASREIPAGKISPNSALIFVIINSLLFVTTTGFINRLTLYLSPVALLVILGYSLTKRFTSLSHLFLGLSLSLSPVGAYIAVTGRFDIIPVLYGIVVISWVGGFDIIYAVQDLAFDSQNSLFSIPSRLGAPKALIVSKVLHGISVIAVFTAGITGGSDIIYFTGAVLFTLMLIFEHYLVDPDDSRKINIAFATVNSLAGLIFSTFAITDLYIHF